MEVACLPIIRNAQWNSTYTIAKPFCIPESHHDFSPIYIYITRKRMNLTNKHKRKNAKSIEMNEDSKQKKHVKQ